MWATEAEKQEQWHSETYTPEELEAYYEHLYEQQRYEIEAENGWLRAAENDDRMYDPREW